MKLKKAVNIAKKLGYKWVAVDENGEVWMYSEDFTAAFANVWRFWQTLQPPFISDAVYLGKYTGSKHWVETLRDAER